MKATWIKDFDLIEAAPGNIGRRQRNWGPWLLVCCPVCHYLHLVDERWAWNQETLTLSPSYRCDAGQRGVCHWNLTNGEFIVHGDSTAKPRSEETTK